MIHSLDDSVDAGFTQYHASMAGLVIGACVTGTLLDMGAFIAVVRAPVSSSMLQSFPPHSLNVHTKSIRPRDMVYCSISSDNEPPTGALLGTVVLRYMSTSYCTVWILCSPHEADASSSRFCIVTPINSHNGGSVEPWHGYVPCPTLFSGCQAVKLSALPGQASPCNVTTALAG